MAVGSRPIDAWRRETRSGSRRSVSDRRRWRQGGRRPRACWKRWTRVHRVRRRSPAGAEQAVGRGQPRRQRHQLRRHRDPARAAAEQDRWNWCTGWIGTRRACWSSPRSARRCVELQALLREDHGAGIRKRYLALLVGRMPDGVMTVDAPLHVGLRQGGERHVQVNPTGKPSMSHFKVLERRGGHSRIARSASKPAAPTRSACMPSTWATRWPATTSTAIRRSTSGCATRSG